MTRKCSRFNHEEELRDAIAESWRSFWSLGVVAQRCVVAGLVGFGVATFLAWKVMIPLIVFAFAFISTAKLLQTDWFASAIGTACRQL